MGHWNKIPNGEICYICEKKAVLREKYIEKYLCRSCYMKNYNKDYNHRQDSNPCIKKSLAGNRTGFLNKNCSKYKGNLFENLSDKWKQAKNLNKENDNYNSRIDHWCEDLGYFQTKGRILKHNIGGKCYHGWNLYSINDQGKIFDFVIVYCTDKDMMIIERIYLFPKNEWLFRNTITIYKNSKYGWYENYRIKDEETLKIVNEIWIDIIKINIKEQ